MAASLDTRSRARTAPRESGVALVAVIGVIVIATILTAAIATSLLGSNSRSSARSERVALQNTVEAGANAYARALSVGSVNERTFFALTEGAARAIVAPGSTRTPADDASGSFVIPQSHASVAAKYRLTSDDGVHERDGASTTAVRVHSFKASSNPVTNEQWVVRTLVPGSSPREYTFWQVIRVDVPSTIDVGSELNAYVRAWRGNGETVSRERVVRLELTAGFFSDYQMLVNSTVMFESGARLNGPIHSNGTSSTPGVTPAGGHSIAGSAVVCDPSASVTTGRGTISLPPLCSRTPNTGSFIDFGRVSHSFDQIAEDCGLVADDGIRCFPALASSSWRVTLESTRIVVSNGTTTTNIPTALGEVHVLLFHDDVSVQGTTNARVTIAARHPENAANNSANITITGDVRTVAAAAGAPRRSVVGLMAEGHVIVAIPTPEYLSGPSTCRPTKDPLNPPTAASPSAAQAGSIDRQIDAAIIAASGGLRIPPEWTTYGVPSIPPLCKSITIKGSISAHYAPVLVWQWPAEHYKTGFETRTYEWDPTLRENPPPYFPLSRTWETMTVKDANLDCLRGGSRQNDWTCR